MTATSTLAPARHKQELLGQTVVVIGGSLGIGLETARLAREEGAAVTITPGSSAPRRPGPRCQHCGLRRD
jgi:NAD(P)-dependent dehydrogenase (short-subunit alcohol dehydrogenase family)